MVQVNTAKQAPKKAPEVTPKPAAAAPKAAPKAATPPKPGPQRNSKKEATAPKPTEAESTDLVPAAEELPPEVIEQRAAECKERIAAASQTIGESYYELAEALHEAYEGKYFKQWGFETMEEWADAELDIGFRKAYYFIGIVKAVRAANLTKDQVISIGWTKMALIAPLIEKDPTTAEKWVGEAGEKNAKELNESIRLSKGVKAKPEVLRVSCRFDAEHGKIVTDALTVAYAEIGAEDVSKALAHICSEWVMQKGASGGGAATAEDYAAFIEKKFPFKVTLDPVEAGSVEEIVGAEGTEEGAEGTDDVSDLLALDETD